MTPQLLNPPAPPAAAAASTTEQLKKVITKATSPADGLVSGSWKLRQQASPLETRYVAS